MNHKIISLLIYGHRFCALKDDLPQSAIQYDKMDLLIVLVSQHKNTLHINMWKCPFTFVKWCISALFLVFFLQAQHISRSKKSKIEQSFSLRLNQKFAFRHRQKKNQSSFWIPLLFLCNGIHLILMLPNRSITAYLLRFTPGNCQEKLIKIKNVSYITQ